MAPEGLPPPSLLRRFHETLEAPIDPAGLAAFRILFGVLVAAGSARFLASGFIHKLYQEDAFYFRYSGLESIPVPAPSTVELLYMLFVALGIFIAAGLFFRAALLAFLVLFVWVQLIDVTNYLNHYYLVLLLGSLLLLSPAHACFSLDARYFGAQRDSVPFFFLALLRFQVACVYVFAAIAKVGTDWLLAGQPLGLWLPAQDELPLLGSVLALPFAPLLFSWCGLLYDATIVLWLSWKRTRPLAWAVVLVFHSMTFLLFQIGMFPFIMSVATTLFFSPSWPRRLVRSARPVPARAANAAAVPLHRVWIVVGAMWCTFNVLLPLRTFVLTDNVLWDEAGMRFSWRVMVREKSGSLTYRVTLPEGRVVLVSPYDVLSQRQVNEMIGQPDMILRLAHHLKDRFQSSCPRAVVGCSPVEVRVDALISLNGRPLRRFVDERVDLARMQDTWGRPTWILPPPPEAARSSWRH